MTSDNKPAPSRRDPDYVDPEGIGIDRPGLHPNSPGGRPHNEPFRDIVVRHMQRRAFLKGAAATVPVLMFGGTLLKPTEAEAADGLTFVPTGPSKIDDVDVPGGYNYEVVLSWGDPLFPGVPDFNPNTQTPNRQRKQFGFNCDFVGYFPIVSGGADAPAAAGDKNGLLCVNHEYTTGGDMFPGYVAGATKEVVDIELAAHGGTVAEVKRTWSGWNLVQDSPFNRRITGDTHMRITGPAAGHPLMQTADDPTGRHVLGMLNNCAGGKTPWGTWLTCEENFNQYFANNGVVADAAIKAAHTRYGVPSGATGRLWENFYDRFDCSKQPTEPFRFGWVVEIDPFDPNSVPRKRTALGRLKHEGATCALANSGQVVVYSGDDERFDYVYKYVSDDPFVAANRALNDRLLDKGTLYVAKFKANGRGVWLPLTMANPVLAANFSDLGEILIKTRLAGDLVGATPMDRPEDCQVNGTNGKVYLTMTNNSARTVIHTDPGSAAANPRVPNPNGHIIELIEGDGGDLAATTFRWRIFLLCGDPNVDLKTDPADLVPGLDKSATYYAGFADPAQISSIAAPDNITFDNKGNLWIATDGQPFSVDLGNINDSVYAVPTAGPNRGRARRFMSGVPGGEVCGPEFTPDGKTFFVAIQHPGEDAGFPNALSNWPDRGVVPRPSVIAIRRLDGGRVGV